MDIGGVEGVLVQVVIPRLTSIVVVQNFDRLLDPYPRLLATCDIVPVDDQPDRVFDMLDVSEVHFALGRVGLPDTCPGDAHELVDDRLSSVQILACNWYGEHRASAWSHRAVSGFSPRDLHGPPELHMAVIVWLCTMDLEDVQLCLLWLSCLLESVHLPLQFLDSQLAGAIAPAAELHR